MSNSGRKKIITIAAACVAAGIIGVTLTGMVMAPGGGMGGNRSMGGSSGGGQRGGSGQENQAAPKTVVGTGVPTMGKIEVIGSFVGTVEPGQQVTVYPKASGEVVEANYNVGDTVEAGAVLFKLDSSTLELDIAQTRANLNVSQAKARLNLETAQTNLENYLNNIEDGLNSSLLQAENNVKTAQNSLEQANVSYASARQDYNDYINYDWDGDYSDAMRDSLHRTKVQAELRVESAQLSLENAKTGLEVARKQVEEQKVSVETNLKTAELGVDFTADSITLQKLEKNLANYTVTAPISGTIERKNIEEYSTVSTQAAAYVISNKDLLSVSFGVAESALEYLKPGDAVTVEKSGETCRGTVSEVSTMVDASSGLYTVKATVENAPFDLHSGSAVKIKAVTQKVENGMIVPIDAVYYDNGKPHVYVFENNTARKVEVEAGISDDKNIHIKSGLSVSDEVIVTWSASLYDGAEVYLAGTLEQEAQAEGGGSPAPADTEARPRREGAPPAN